jgi:hypothetical protein
MFGKSDPNPEIPESKSGWSGPRFQSHIETFFHFENEEQVTDRLNQRGAEGWAVIAVLDKPVGQMKMHGKEAWSVLLQRRVP